MDAAGGHCQRIDIFAKQRRVLGICSDRQDDFDSGIYCVNNGWQDRRGGSGAAGGRARRQTAVAKYDMDFFDRDACLVADDLRNHGVSAGADILGA